MEKLVFCTLFDSYYFSRGVTMYNSLLELCNNFKLYIFAFDTDCYEKLIELNLKHAIIIPLADFEDTDLLSVKKSRTKAEYCWTTTSSTILYIFKHFEESTCTYIDADLYFYKTPKVLIDEIGNSSIALTEHNYYKKYDQSSTSGIYCVQFVYFKNDSIGLEALNWWRECCIDWCYSRLEDGKFGDQKYLDDWTVRFKKVHVIQNIGAGVALWNIERFNLLVENKIYDKYTEGTYDIVFYHFHGLKLSYKNNVCEVAPTKFNLNDDFKNKFYIPYIKRLNLIDNLPVNGIRFKEVLFLIKLYLPLHFLLKKNVFLQRFKALFVNSSK